MEKRKFDLIKEDIMAFEDWKSVRPDPDIRPFIGKTIYTYEAYPAKLKIINENTKQVTTFNGKFCGKRVMFKIDHDRGLITIEGIIKPPKDPLKKLFWEKGFTGARRYKSIEEFNNSTISNEEWFKNDFHIPSIETQKKAREYFKYILKFIRDYDGKIKVEHFYAPNTDFPIVAQINIKNKSWWVSEDLTLEEAKLILDGFDNCKV